MGLDAEAIRQLLTECGLNEAKTPEQLLEVALKLLYPKINQRLTLTPPTENHDPHEPDLYSESQERRDQEELDILVLRLLKMTWQILNIAIRMSSNVEFIAVCQREQALLILRILYNKSNLFTLTDRMHQVILTFIDQAYLNINYAEELIAKAANAKDVIAQLSRVRCVLLMCEKRQPLQKIAKPVETTPMFQCFHSWVTNNLEIQQQLQEFSNNLIRTVQKAKNPYALGLKILIHDSRSIDLITLFADPANQPLVEFLKNNLSILQKVDIAFKANWNELKMTPVASKQKAIRQKLFGEDFPLDRSKTMPRTVNPPAFFQKKRRSEPKLSKAILESQTRKRDPSDYILDVHEDKQKEAKKARI
ncbi:MAG: hypothetical protein M3R00_08725 [Pseudomonadota bacterium]|nr:hypothetical protein [Pseudomonadota bacterium]